MALAGSLAEAYALKRLLDDTLPNHVYDFEPVSRNYTVQGDLWDHLYDEHAGARGWDRSPGEATRDPAPFLPLTLELGSWLWVKKNPRQIFDVLGGFNPIRPHRLRRTLRRHLPLFEFLLRAVAGSGAWSSFAEDERRRLESEAFRLWFRSDQTGGGGRIGRKIRPATTPVQSWGEAPTTVLASRTVDVGVANSSALAGPWAELAARLSEELVAELQRGLTTVSDDAYLSWLVGFLRRATGLGFAFVGELWGEDSDRVQTLALESPEGPAENFEYDLLGTPCSNVVGRDSACVYPREVAPKFPDDGLLVEMGIEGYIGLGLFAPSGRPLGLMVLLDNQPISEEDAAFGEQLLLAFQGRTQTVLVHRRTLRSLKLFEAQLDPTGHEDVLEHLTRAIAGALHLQAGFVVEYSDEASTRLRVVASSLDEDGGEPLEFAAATGPWQPVEPGGSLHLRDCGERFPDDPLLRRSGADTLLMRALHDPRGRPLGFLGVVHDRPVHEDGSDQTLFKLVADRAAFELQRRRVEEARRAAERTSLERQRIESLGMLASGVAHDFNNLLVGVLGNADLALTQVPEDNPARPFLSSIVSSAEQAGRMCQQLLAYAGRGETEISRFELGPVVEDLAGMVRGSLPNNCELVLALDPEPIWIEGDRTQIMQVLMNLVTNAADAIGEQAGTITVRTVTTDVAAGALSELRRARKAELAPGPYACVHVEDTGSGMDPTTLERVFEPFFTTKADGHGLGLAAMLGIVERHGGGVRVRSELGRGATFTMCLPQVEASAPEG